MKKIVAIAAGGDSAEAEISYLSAKTVLESLDRSKYEPILVKMELGNWEAHLNGQAYPIDKNHFSFDFEGKRVQFDYVFIAIHGTPGEDGKLQAYFDLMKIPYSSPDHIGATLTFNKWYCNTLLNQLGYQVADSVYLRKTDAFNEGEILKKVGLPCFVKPCSCGSSFGITKVKNEDALLPAIAHAFEFDHEILIEANTEGSEMTCGVYRHEGELIALPITQIIPNGEFFDFEAKYKGDSLEITPARISESQRDQIQNISKEIYSKLDMRGIVRVDFILKGETPYIIEMNAVPGMSQESLIPQAVNASGISLSEFYSRIIEETAK